MPDVDWILEEPPATDNPADLRAYLRDARKIPSPDTIAKAMIVSAERRLARLEKEQDQDRDAA
jgi:hypothetical protein